MMYGKIILVVVCQLFVNDPILCEVSLICNQEIVQRCWSFLQNSSVFNDVVPAMDKSSLADFCSKFDYFDKCFSPIRSNCINTLSFSLLATYEGHQNAFNYLCKETSSEYLSYQPCFNDQNLKINTKRCNETLNEQLNRIHNETDVVTTTNRLCQAGDLYLGCVDNNVKVMCQGSAADWTKNFNRKMLSPLFSSIVCPGWTAEPISNSNVDTTAITLGVCFGVICFVIVVLILILLCCMKPQLFKSVPVLRQIKFFSASKQDNSCPPPYINDPASQESPIGMDRVDQQVNSQTMPCERGSCSSGYFSSLERTLTDENVQYLHDPMNTNRIDIADELPNKYRNARSQSAECVVPVSSRAPGCSLNHSTSLAPLHYSSTITPPHFEPPAANPFTSLKSNSETDDPIITDFYC